MIVPLTFVVPCMLCRGDRAKRWRRGRRAAVPIFPFQMHTHQVLEALTFLVFCVTPFSTTVVLFVSRTKRKWTGSITDDRDAEIWLICINAVFFLLYLLTFLTHLLFDHHKEAPFFVVPSAIKEGSEGMRMEYYKCTLDGCTGKCQLEYKYLNGDAYNPYIDEPHDATGSACTSGTSCVPAPLVVRSSPGAASPTTSAASPASVKMSWASNQS